MDKISVVQEYERQIATRPNIIIRPSDWEGVWHVENEVREIRLTGEYGKFGLVVADFPSPVNLKVVKQEFEEEGWSICPRDAAVLFLKDLTVQELEELKRPILTPHYPPVQVRVSTSEVHKYFICCKLCRIDEKAHKSIFLTWADFQEWEDNPLILGIKEKR